MPSDPGGIHPLRVNRVANADEIAVMFDRDATPRVRSDMAPVWLRRSVRGLAAALLAVVAACGSSAAARNDGDQRVAAIYRAVILAIAEPQPAPEPKPGGVVGPRPD